MHGLGLTQKFLTKCLVSDSLYMGLSLNKARQPDPSKQSNIDLCLALRFGRVVKVGCGIDFFPRFWTFNNVGIVGLLRTAVVPNCVWRGVLNYIFFYVDHGRRRIASRRCRGARKPRDSKNTKATEYTKPTESKGMMLLVHGAFLRGTRFRW